MDAKFDIGSIDRLRHHSIDSVCADVEKIAHVKTYIKTKINVHSLKSLMKLIYESQIGVVNLNLSNL